MTCGIACIGKGNFRVIVQHASDPLWEVSLFYSNKIKAEARDGADKIRRKQNTHIYTTPLFSHSFCGFRSNEQAIPSIPPFKTQFAHAPTRGFICIQPPHSQIKRFPRFYFSNYALPPP